MPKSGVNFKGFSTESNTGGIKTKGSKVIQTRGTRICKSKVKSTPEKTPIKGKLIQTKLNLKPIKIELIQTEQLKTSMDELVADDNEDFTVDQ